DPMNRHEERSPVMTARQKPRFAPAVEVLEDRCLLSAGLSFHRHARPELRSHHAHAGHHPRHHNAVRYRQPAVAPTPVSPAPGAAVPAPVDPPPAGGPSVTSPPAPTPDLAEHGVTGSAAEPADLGGFGLSANDAQVQGTTQDSSTTQPGVVGDIVRLWNDMQEQVTDTNNGDAQYIGGEAAGDAPAERAATRPDRLVLRALA